MKKISTTREVFIILKNLYENPTVENWTVEEFEQLDREYQIFLINNSHRNLLDQVDDAF